MADDTAATRRARNIIFRAADAPLLEATDMMTYAASDRDAAPPVEPEGGADGARVSVLFRQPEAGSFSLVHAYFKANYLLPRHTHNADCLYYVVSGEVRLGAQVLRAGDGFFVPAGNPYAYQAGPDGVEILEFRSTNTFDIDVLEDKLEFWERFRAMPEVNREAWQASDVPPSWRGVNVG